MTRTKGEWAGLALTALVILFLIADGIASMMVPPTLAQEMAATGWGLWTGPVVGVIALTSALIYAIPRTSAIGAILITGFMGGAISAHLRLGEIGSPPQLICTLVGVAAWGGLWLRYPVVRAILPALCRRG